ncbi:MAG: nicotinamide mononucleotide deamidase-related protein [Candidatus Bathyarchaeia archaeon]
MSTHILEIICVGNELLIGKTLNTNAHWLAKRVTSLGLNIRRIVVVGDNVDEIASAIKEAIQRKPKLIITTGGLGPTFDDKTLEGVAKALERELEENNEALEMVKKKYQSYVAEGRMEKFEMTPPRVKMAKLPKGSKPLPNPVGTAPGVLVEHTDTIIVALPGVPQEMMAIFDESIAPMLQKLAGDLIFYEASLDIRGMPESELAPIIDRVMHDNPYVYVKSHPRVSEKSSHIELHFSTTSKNQGLAKQRIEQAITQISEIIQDKGARVQTPKT